MIFFLQKSAKKKIFAYGGGGLRTLRTGPQLLFTPSLKPGKIEKTTTSRLEKIDKKNLRRFEKKNLKEIRAEEF